MNVMSGSTISLFIFIFFSCKTVEKASTHGLLSGYYKLKHENRSVQDVYLDINDQRISVFDHSHRRLNKKDQSIIFLDASDSAQIKNMLFKKQSLDIDITSILLKYRPSISGLPAQLNTDLNIALYAGWRHDRYNVTRGKDPLGKRYSKISSMGYDVGFFAGTGTTMINAFTTNNKRIDEYSGMILQAGFAGFLESEVASFGLSIGYDLLLSPDHKIWIYNQKPWIGFIVGIALN